MPLSPHQVAGDLDPENFPDGPHVQLRVELVRVDQRPIDIEQNQMYAGRSSHSARRT